MQKQFCPNKLRKEMVNTFVVICKQPIWLDHGLRPLQSRAKYFAESKEITKPDTAKNVSYLFFPNFCCSCKKISYEWDILWFP